MAQKIPTLGAGVVKSLRARAKTTKRYNFTDLAKVYRRGQGAYLGAGSRPGVSMSAWAFGRVNSFIRGGRHDQDIRRVAAKRNK
tara:strand:- start:1075 stop:1326 length:252 start_codon:yes stop_codon:yes gene_type:complete